MLQFFPLARVLVLILPAMTFHKTGIDAPSDWGYSDRIVSLWRSCGTRRYSSNQAAAGIAWPPLFSSIDIQLTGSPARAATEVNP